MPLETNNPWTQGNCSYAALQYMAAGVPVVASPMGMSADLIQHDVNGLLASTPEEWELALDRLLSDETLRARLGEAGRKTVEEQYTYPVQARRWAHFLSRVAR
jgi:glycosyltransferase involved in cell wall biosynthesis